jgi:segregation and condensation protein A
MPYEVRTPVFEGPFDLLLHLILREQVDLYDVRLSTIVDAYLGELERLEALDLDVATEFLLIAATLVELKTRRLLPGDDDLALDEELALWDERDALLARLLECKTFKDVSRTLQRMAADAGRSVARTAGPEEHFIALTPDVLAGVSAPDLRAAFLRAVAPKPVPRIDLDHVAPVRASVADAVADLVRELAMVGRTTFRRLTAGFTDKLAVIVHFLAVLELFKQGAVDLAQGERFGDIVVVWLGFDAEEAQETDEIAAGAVIDLTAVDAYEG